MGRFYRSTRVLMGASLELTVFGAAGVCSNAVAAAFCEVDRIERLFTIFRADSPIARVNAVSKEGEYLLDKEVIDILKIARDYAERSGGAFDPTSGPSINLWGFGSQDAPGRPPSQQALASTTRSVGFRKLRVFPEDCKMAFLKDGMALNFGGIAKGYAIDRTVQILREHGISRALVSFGSSLYGLGAPPGTSGWRIAIQHPRYESAAIETVLLCDRALSTSGDYERCFFYDGKRFSHIIDPRSGQAVSGMASVSVIAPKALDADVFSTAAFVLGEKEGVDFLEDCPKAEGLVIPLGSNGELCCRRTAGWTAVSDSEKIGRRRFMAMAAAMVAGLVLPATVEGTTIRFATEDEALKRLVPDAEDFDLEKQHLSDRQLSAAQELAGKGFRKRDYPFWIGRRGNQIAGYATRLNVIGKERPITFLIGFDPDGAVYGVEVLIYRESRGSEVRYERFMKQFVGKKTGDSFRLGQEVLPISGATLSSRATAYAVKKGLALFEVLYKDKEVR
ncbi:MAG: FAD:protein FMN transferase [Nitrospiria bacterium]